MAVLAMLVVSSSGFMSEAYVRGPSFPRVTRAPKIALKMSVTGDEETFIMVKPDGVSRGLAGRILQRFEDKGLKLVRSKFTMADPDTLNEHYAHIADKPFYPEVFDCKLKVFNRFLRRPMNTKFLSLSLSLSSLSCDSYKRNGTWM
jgi:hypothetical protein